MNMIIERLETKQIIAEQKRVNMLQDKHEIREQWASTKWEVMLAYVRHVGIEVLSFTFWCISECCSFVYCCV